MDIENLLVIGSGAMGSQIGLVGALAGYDITIQDVSTTALGKTREALSGASRKSELYLKWLPSARG
ncbi:hypothetical protein GCM10009596_29320 [Arthrobacter rhombi]|uniref:3-hydroxyacyl-CoA dehydrogenase NAD-binding domain-containing protein n=1 Tax=Arthrobacter rhombi TaxID=71253 RepID=UPI0031D943AA